MFLILIRSAERADPHILSDILDLLGEIMDDTPPLSLSDGPQFSPDIANGLKPLLDYVRLIVQNNDSSPDSRSRATRVLLLFL